MKRSSDDNENTDISLPELPKELWVVICSYDWSLSGPMARTCKFLLGEMVKNLKEIVESSVERGWLYPWLLLSLGEEYLPQNPARVQDIIVDGGKSVFITGGALSQRVYGKEWEGDIDIWYERGNPNEEFIVLPNRKRLDTVESQSSTNQERCIENFDLSVVQQGYFSDSEKSFCTPLALYSRQEKVIIAIPCRECIDYTDARCALRNNARLVDIWYYINKHVSQHEKTINEYHLCSTCSEDASTGHEIFQRWRKRMRRYSKRFPEYKIVYMRWENPSINREIDRILDKRPEYILDELSKRSDIY